MAAVPGGLAALVVKAAVIVLAALVEPLIAASRAGMVVMVLVDEKVVDAPPIDLVDQSAAAGKVSKVRVLLGTGMAAQALAAKPAKAAKVMMVLLNFMFSLRLNC